MIEAHHTPRVCEPLRAIGHVVGILLVLLPAEAFGVSFFQVGNSFTKDSKPEGLAAMIEQALGEPVSNGYHVRGSQTLDSLWNNPQISGTETTDFGDHTVALPNNVWDFLTLQSFPSENPITLGEEVARIQDFVSAADVGGGGDTEIVVYGPWAGRGRSWDRWDEEVVDSLDQETFYSHHYHDLLYDKVNELYPGRVRLASAGRVIRTMIDTFLIPDEEGKRDWDYLYRDRIHLNELGRFAASTTLFTVMTKINPIGMPVPREVTDWGVQAFSDEEALAIQEIVWEVVTEDRRSGVSPIGDLNVDTVIDEADRLLWSESYGAKTDLTADPNEDGVVDQLDGLLWAEAYSPGVEDIDGSGAVGEPDLWLWRDAYGSGAGGPADLNNDGSVDAADYTLWRDAFELADDVDFDGDGVVTTADRDIWISQLGWATELGADANEDGVVNAVDYTVWRDGLAAAQAAGTSFGVPEPSSVALLITAASFVGRRRRV
ncbi:hypothetical protein MalM25_29620 [Planctomycetes bacterium MalM25]|nr:hypothetical protein MalM25_29620 [Planctomycetes bacterium MalM25]